MFRECWYFQHKHHFSFFFPLEENAPSNIYNIISHTSISASTYFGLVILLLHLHELKLWVQTRFSAVLYKLRIPNKSFNSMLWKSSHKPSGNVIGNAEELCPEGTTLKSSVKLQILCTCSVSSYNLKKWSSTFFLAWENLIFLLWL